MTEVAPPPVAVPVTVRADPAPAPRPRPAPGYFERTLPPALILGSFAAVTLPMAAVVLAAPSHLLVWLYVWLFGMTHFVITLTVYMQSANLRHFWGTWPRRVLFLAAPVAVLVGFDLLHAFRVGAEFPVFAVLFWGFIRLMDFNHFGRQAFGVYQMFKGRTGLRPPAALKRVESGAFLALTALLFTTFLAGGLNPLLQPGGPLTLLDLGAPPVGAVLPLDFLQALSAALLVISLGLLAAAAAGLVRAWRVGGRPDGLGFALAYLAVQAGCGLIAAVSFPLYLAALAVHYVEYHVLMAPRCFRARLDPAWRVDRAFAALRANRVVFYAAVVAVAGLVTAFGVAGMAAMGRVEPGSAAAPFAYLVLVAVFDGLFVLHYFVEMFIWRFSDPHFRRSLAGLYFAPKVG